MAWQRRALLTALARGFRLPPRIGLDLFRLGLSRGDRLLDLLQRQLKLVWVQLLGGGAILQTLVAGDQLLKPQIDELERRDLVAQLRIGGEDLSLFFAFPGNHFHQTGGFGGLRLLAGFQLLIAQAGEPKGGAKRLHIIRQLVQNRAHATDSSTKSSAWRPLIDR